MCITSTRKAYVETETASTRTVKIRGNIIRKSIDTIAGSNIESLTRQTSALVKSFDEDERLRILKLGNIPPVIIDEESMVAMKADMGVPWEKLKTMARYTVF